MFKKIIKALIFVSIIIAPLFAYERDDKLNIISLLRPDNIKVPVRPDNIKVPDGIDNNQKLCLTALAEAWKAHMWELRNKENAPQWIQFDNPKFANSVYSVIISEIARAVLKINPYSTSAKYEVTSAENGVKNFLEFFSAEGFVGLDQYEDSNWNMLVLINFLNKSSTFTITFRIGRGALSFCSK